VQGLPWHLSEKYLVSEILIPFGFLSHVIPLIFCRSSSCAAVPLKPTLRFAVSARDRYSQGDGRILFGYQEGGLLLKVDLLQDAEQFNHQSGASPREGSSSIISLGRAINALPMTSICCSPPERYPLFCWRRFTS